MKTFIHFALAYSVLLSACEQRVEPIDERISLLKLESLPQAVYPSSNRPSLSKRNLGKLLFYDPILSGEKDIACATCHIASQGYTDGIDLSIGVGGKGLGKNRVDFSGGRIPVVGRNSQSIINTAYNGLIAFHQDYDPLTAPMFWDARKKSLENQTLGPLTSYNEMRGDGFNATAATDSIINRLKEIEEYQQFFATAFGSPDSITQENIGKAIATFERTIVSANSPYDKYATGDDTALTPEQKTGLLLFFGKANCVNCHSGPMFSDYNYYNLGIPYNPKRTDPDRGVDNRFAFRTPSLRNVALTAPYMHNGMLPTLQAVIEYYTRAKSANPDVVSIDAKIQPLDLTVEEITAIIEFLKSLTDDSYDQEMPVRVPSGLKPGGS